MMGPPKDDMVHSARSVEPALEQCRCSGRGLLRLKLLGEGSPQDGRSRRGSARLRLRMTARRVSMSKRSIEATRTVASRLTIC